MGNEAIEHIAVIGAGLMGHGIALEFALAGYHVRIHDRGPEHLEKATTAIRDNLRRLESIGRVATGLSEEALERITPCVTLDDAVKDADLVIEAVFEDLPLKQELFEQLESLCPPWVIFASNTSSIMPSQLSARMKHPGRLVIAHYFNPPYLIPLVEIVPGPATTEATVRTVTNLLEGLGKRPVVLGKEATGFVANRLQLALYREAISIVEQGIASPEDVDRVVRHGFGRRLAAAGPFEIFDLAGLDTISSVAAQIIPEIQNAEAVVEPATSVLQKKVERGELGVKAGKGFRDWPPTAAEDLKRRLTAALTRPELDEGTAGR